MTSDSAGMDCTSPTLPATSSLAAQHVAKSSNKSYTFLIHSDSSQSNQSVDNVPHVDKYAHTRTKRKRTSPEDLAILEAEYQRSSRPEKALRLDIVSRVSLSEKEVQIWFQNRRQMTRRKCRTWQPNEITSIIRSSQETAGSKMSQNDTQNKTLADQNPTQSSQSSIDSVEPTIDSSFISSSDSNSEAHASTSDAIHLPEQLQHHAAVEERYISVTNESMNARIPALPMDSSFSGASTAFSIDNISGKIEDSCSQETQISELLNSKVTTPVKRLKRASSSVRLSMSLDGKAKILVGESPSPPRKHLTPTTFTSRPSVLKRSQSAIESNDKTYLDLDNKVGWQGPKVSGRSRDARTWEFYCDSDARNALTKTAEHEQKGSALGVIGLIRAGSSGRKPLTPSSKKQNLQLQQIDFGKRKSSLAREGKKAKLARTASSVARLQTSDRGFRKDSDLDIWEDPEGDSDKENWEPGTRHRDRRARSSAASGRGILQENTQLPSHSSSLEALMDRDSTLSNHRKKQFQRDVSNEDKENTEVADDVAAFMGEKRHAREDDELDAVQNLLSLSQGAWR